MLLMLTACCLHRCCCSLCAQQLRDWRRWRFACGNRLATHPASSYMSACNSTSRAGSRPDCSQVGRLRGILNALSDLRSQVYYIYVPMWYLMFLQVMTEAGPWHARKVALGEAKLQDLKRQYMATMTCQGSLHHRPHARMVLLRKPLSSL